MPNEVIQWARCSRKWIQLIMFLLVETNRFDLYVVCWRILWWIHGNRCMRSTYGVFSSTRFSVQAGTNRWVQTLQVYAFSRHWYFVPQFFHNQIIFFLVRKFSEWISNIFSHNRPVHPVHPVFGQNAVIHTMARSHTPSIVSIYK